MRGRTLIGRVAAWLRRCWSCGAPLGPRERKCPRCGAAQPREV
ncbi:MAG: zinc ribbon domain-containing protein [Bacteroidota bacterium]